MSVRLALVLSMGGPVDHPDTASYQRTPSFVGSNTRPWAYPLVLDVLGDWGAVIFQTALSAGAFCALALALAEQVDNRYVGHALGVLVLLIGLTSRVTSWDATLLTESMSISLTALLIVAFIWREQARWMLPLVFVPWLFIRDAHVILGVGVAAVLIIEGLRRRSKLTVITIAATTIWAGAAARNNDNIEAANVLFNIAYHVTTDVDHWHWFVDNGMPVTDSFYVLTFDEQRAAFLHDKALGTWALDEGASTYIRFLIEHPRFTLGGLRQLFIPGGLDNESMVDHTYNAKVDPPGIDVVWPSNASGFTVVLLLFAALSSLLVARAGALNRRFVPPWFLIASTVPHALLVYHGSPLEVARHGVVLSFVLVVSCWWIVALSIDVLAGPSDRSANGDDDATGRTDDT